MSKLNLKRELYGVKKPHRIIGCENCQEDKKCRSCSIHLKMIVLSVSSVNHVINV